MRSVTSCVGWGCLSNYIETAQHAKQVSSVTRPLHTRLANYLSVLRLHAPSSNDTFLWSLHEQCHQLRGWGVVYLLYLLACALQYR
jgi:hypothetical protein